MYNYYAGLGNPTSCSVPSQATFGNNGTVMGYWYQDSVNTSLAHTEANTYDSLNRLYTAAANNLSGGSLWSQTYSIDRYGNMSCSGTGLCTSMSYSATTNRLTAIGSATPTYDAAGDLLTDGSGTGTNTYTWDAESRLASATPYAQNAVTLTYNALGQRVRAASNGFTYDYVFSASGQELGLFNAGAGSWTNYELNVAGRQMRLFASATRWLYHPTVLGSTSMMTDQTGTVQLDTTFYPWGQSWQTAGSNGYWTFAAFWPTQPGTSLYPTLFRQYSSTLGRWLSPDPVRGDIWNPQSLNRYAYALVNPCSLVDPLGLQNDVCDERNPANRDPISFIHNNLLTIVATVEADELDTDPVFVLGQAYLESHIPPDQGGGWVPQSLPGSNNYFGINANTGLGTGPPLTVGSLTWATFTGPPTIQASLDAFISNPKWSGAIQGADTAQAYADAIAATGYGGADKAGYSKLVQGAIGAVKSRLDCPGARGPTGGSGPMGLAALDYLTIWVIGNPMSVQMMYAGGYDNVGWSVWLYYIPVFPIRVRGFIL